MDKFSIQKAGLTKDDINQVVAIHHREIGQGFLSSLGDGALKLIFSLASESDSGLLLVARDKSQERICGFVLGARDTGAFYRDFMLQKSLQAAFYLIPKLFSLDRLRKVLETLLYPSKSEIPEMPRAELLDIVVLKNYQGTGLAQRLFRAFSDVLYAEGVRAFKITTGESLGRAQRFYEKLGARKVGTVQVHRGQETFVYVYEMPRIE